VELTNPSDRSIDTIDLLLDLAASLTSLLGLGTHNCDHIAGLSQGPGWDNGHCESVAVDQDQSA
jgi:hypothetical protein